MPVNENRFSVFSVVKRLPPISVLGAFILLVVEIIILSGFIMPLYSRTGELLLAFYIVRGLLRKLRPRFAYDG